MLKLIVAAACLLILDPCCARVSAQETAHEGRYAGPADDDAFLLPNGWRLTPAGKHVPLADLPLNILVSADGSHALVATSGYNSHDLTLVELASQRKLAVQSAKQSWFGLVRDDEKGEVWWSGGGASVLHRFTWQEGKLEACESYPPPVKPGEPPPAALPTGFRTGVCFDAESGSLFSLAILAKGDTKSFAWGDAESDHGRGGVISRIAAAGQDAAPQSAACGKRPYDVIKARNGLLYVSDWADRKVLVVDPDSLRTLAKIPVGEHPNQLALHPLDDRLFVACASTNSVDVIDTKAGTVQETIVTALFPRSPEGSTPDALAITPDGETLLVANADNNCVAVVDVELVRRSQVKGFIPTGWYPTALATTPDGQTILVGVGKGNQTRPNPVAREALDDAAKPVQAGGYRDLPFPYIGTTLSGSLSIVPMPDVRQLQEYTDQVYRNCPYSDKLLTAAPYARNTAIPTRVGDPSPIKHVIYIIKENRTYDQVFGDLPHGNGEADLVMFGAEVTPNHHKLATEFVLLDNLYCNGHVSADGHPWSTMAYATDYIARNWALSYSGRDAIDDDDEGDLTRAPSGYIWDACRRHGLTYRSYGEYGGRVSQKDGSFRMEGRVPGLVGHVSPAYGLPRKANQKVRDTDNVDVFLEEFHEFETNGDLPRFIVMSLGEDHTQGTTPGAPTPQACVASNDLALGRLVEAVSRSKYWPEIAIFVIEDDAQNGPDHVDAHRTVGLVISPYCRRNHLDSTQYGTVSMLRTMELILGLPPLSQYDAAANPMFESFTDEANLASYEHVEARIDLGAVNQQTAYGAERSRAMDFTEYDRIDDFELNEILWRAIKGADAPLPPAVRRAIAYRNR